MATTKQKRATNSRANKSTAKPKQKRASAKPKQTAKQTERKPVERKMVSVKLTGADGKTSRTVKRPAESHQFGRGGTVRVPELAGAAERASQLVCTDASGQPTNRARIGTKQIALVQTGFVKRTKPADAIRKLVFGGETGRGKSAKNAHKIARDYADGKIGQTDLPDGMRERVSEAARVIGDPAKHKLSGKAFAAALVGLADPVK